MARLWTFLLKATTKIILFTDSSSCRAFTERQGVGSRLKHVDAKFLWLQKAVKDQLLNIEGVSTLVNVSDPGIKPLTRNRRLFLLYLIGVMEKTDFEESFTSVGEAEFNEHLRKKALGQKMKVVRKIVVQFLEDGIETFNYKVPKSFVKAITLMALHPLVQGSNVGVQLDFDSYVYVCVVSASHLLPSVWPDFLLGGCLRWTMVEAWSAQTAFDPAFQRVGQSDQACDNTSVDDWDPFTHQMREYRVLERPEDASDNEIYFRQTDVGLKRRWRPPPRFRARFNVEELDNEYEAVEMEEAEKEVSAGAHDTEMEVDEPAADDTSSLTREHVSLPGSPAHSSMSDTTMPPLPVLFCDWNEFEVIYRHLRAHVREHACRVHEVEMVSIPQLKQYLHMCLSELFPGQPDGMFDYPLWWNSLQKHGWKVFQKTLVHGLHDDNFGSFVEQWWVQTDAGVWADRHRHE